VATFSTNEKVDTIRQEKLNINEKDILQYLISNGIIDMSDVENKVKQNRIQEVLQSHPYKIYQGSNGRWYTYVVDDTKQNNRRRIVKSTKEKLNKALYEHYKAQDESVKLAKTTLYQLYPKWREYKSLHTTADTYITRIESDWKKYYLGTDIINIPINKLEKLILDEWAHGLIKSYNMTKNQYYNATVIMRQALTYAMDLGIIENNPMEQVKIDGKRLFRKVKKKADETQVYFKEELEELKTMAWEDFHNRTKVYQLAPLAVLLQFATGMRISELCVIRYDDISDSRHIHIQRMLRRDTGEVVEHTKGTYGDRTAILTNEAQKIISCARQRQEELGVDNTGYIFSINGQPLSYRAVADLYRKYCNKLDIVCKSSHKARKTYISTLIDGNVNINTIREMVGHADERTTYNNYCFDRSTEEEKINMIESALA